MTGLAPLDGNFTAAHGMWLKSKHNAECNMHFQAANTCSREHIKPYNQCTEGVRYVTRGLHIWNDPIGRMSG
jgi:hypothetical protein